LLDTVVEAAQGLRRELALPPVSTRPADDVVAAGGAVTQAAAEVQDREGRARADDDPGVLEALLSLPQVHLVVDGYNVTKEGYGGLTLEQQRDRLTGSLIALVARTRVEATVVFDGASVDARIGGGPRGVRVVFSPPGETADEVIRRLVRAEPPGRPVIVVSSDREVADGVAAAGARPVPSRTLLQLLGRA
jgi:predicted RNA-binding protein with PIN domain